MKLQDSFEVKCESILELAQRFRNQGCEWHELSNYVFDSDFGIVAATFPDSETRQRFYNSPEYKQVNEILLNMMREKGIL